MANVKNIAAKTANPNTAKSTTDAKPANTLEAKKLAAKIAANEAVKLRMLHAKLAGTLFHLLKADQGAISLEVVPVVSHGSATFLCRVTWKGQKEYVVKENGEHYALPGAKSAESYFRFYFRGGLRTGDLREEDFKKAAVNGVCTSLVQTQQAIGKLIFLTEGDVQKVFQVVVANAIFVAQVNNAKDRAVFAYERNNGVLPGVNHFPMVFAPVITPF